jgi:hypothetical protein
MLEHIPGYGYLRVFGPDAFEFVKIRDWESSGGRRRRHKTRRVNKKN